MSIISKINHLYWRAGFGLSPSEFKFYNYSLEENVSKLFNQARNAQALQVEFQDLLTGSMMSKEEKRKKSVESVQKIKNDWLIRMTKPEQSALLERMCLFWHGHFACRIVLGNKQASNYLSTIRKHALGNFRDLLMDIAKDPAMIRYLNNQQNKKGQPNENFARELMELFTIGRGNYTEKDIKESARAFTGWSSTIAGDYIFRKRQHDYGSKEFMGQKGRFNGDDIINIILSKKQTARFITEKVYRYFVNEHIDEQIVEELSDQFYSSNYDIEKLMRAIFQSPWFYDGHNLGSKIKSPIDLIVGLMRTLEMDVGNKIALIGIQRQLGQILLNPPNVAGWPGGKNWIDNATLLTRLNLSSFIFISSGLVNGDLSAMTKRFNAFKIKANTTKLYGHFSNYTKDEIVTKLSELLIPGKNSHASNIEYGIRLRKKKDFFNIAMMRILSTPEYQTC
jgi:uncharacterized protein (DUF1800 family)